MKQPTAGATKQFAVCVNNHGYPAALERRKIYRVLPDLQASKQKLIRILDESGEDYLYPADYFVLLRLPQTVVEALSRAA
jgi:hypothetical protein